MVCVRSNIKSSNYIICKIISKIKLNNNIVKILDLSSADVKHIAGSYILARYYD